MAGVPLAVLLTVLTLLLAGCGGEEITPPSPSGDDTDARAAAASATLSRLRRALADDDPAAVRALAAPDRTSRDLLAAIADNARALDLTGIGLRYVDPDPSALPARVGAYGRSAFGVTVSLSWRLTGFDREPVRTDTRFVFVRTPRGARLAAVGGGQGRTPLWLAEPLAVVRGPRTLVMTGRSRGGDDRAATLAGQARRAVADVRRVLPRWQGRLVVEEPASEEQLEQVLDADPGTYRAIAGVTTTVDGMLVAGSPVHVFLNPDVYDGLGPRGQQVVLSHEATHVATRAAFSQGAPTWLLEGFADYVALVHANVPLATAGRQILARVRKDGPPDALPSADDLAPSAPGLGATYEEAWTVCRYLAGRYGEAALVRFYDSVSRGTTLDAAFRALGTSQRAFVAGWRADLRRLAAR